MWPANEKELPSSDLEVAESTHREPRQIVKRQKLIIKRWQFQKIVDNKLAKNENSRSDILLFIDLKL